MWQLPRFGSRGDTDTRTRVPEAAVALAAAENGGPAVTAESLATSYGVSTRTTL
ncbi:hypothetical protein Slala03_53620 [Streptomyces lavendulae subsp. lavendulae]|nr:hypothetical protein Slala03_53620 [Streptomyces lavendulae subsp. lavendulae]